MVVQKLACDLCRHASPLRIGGLQSRWSGSPSRPWACKNETKARKPIKILGFPRVEAPKPRVISRINKQQKQEFRGTTRQRNRAGLSLVEGSLHAARRGDPIIPGDKISSFRKIGSGNPRTNKAAGRIAPSPAPAQERLALVSNGKGVARRKGVANS